MAIDRAKRLDIDDTKVANIGQVIQQLPGKGCSLRSLIADLQSDIQEAMSRGYSYKEMAEILNAQGIKIAPRTLRLYLKQDKSKAKPKPPPAITPAKPMANTTDPKPSRTIGDFSEMPDVL
jgi:hypothetical protein